MKLIDQVRDVVRKKHYSIRTEQAYVQWIRRFILFHNKRHPKDMGEMAVEYDSWNVFVFVSRMSILVRIKSYQAIAPFLWVPGCMEDAVDGHLPTSVLVKDGVRKSPHQCPTILLMDFRVEFRHAKLPEYRRSHSRETLHPSQIDDFRTSNMPHRRPVVLLARLLVQRP